jgi:hypothetical protein
MDGVAGVPPPCAKAALLAPRLTRPLVTTTKAKAHRLTMRIVLQSFLT